MKHFLSLPLSAMLSLLTVSAHAQAASQSDRQMIADAHWLSAEQARPATSSDTTTLKAVPDLTKTAGQYHDLCGTRVTPKILPLDVGGAPGPLTAVIEEDPACFGGGMAPVTLCSTERGMSCGRTPRPPLPFRKAVMTVFTI